MANSPRYATLSSFKALLPHTLRHQGPDGQTNDGSQSATHPPTQSVSQHDGRDKHVKRARD
jgi:hypothetical protein